jgi:hypothetical protein
MGGRAKIVTRGFQTGGVDGRRLARLPEIAAKINRESQPETLINAPR